MKRPKTNEELAALPVGPEFGLSKYEVTSEDREQGFAIVNGRKICIDGQARYISIPIAPAVVAEYIGPDDVLAFNLEGETWVIGKYADGRYFRRRTGL